MINGQAPSKTSVCLYVCTFRRNDQLTRLLETVEIAAKKAAEVAEVGVVVVDDNPDGVARPVLGAFQDVFPLGIHYRHSGAGNISIARNIGLETAAGLADWVLMTDDDCEVCEDWIVEYLRVQALTEADALCGPHRRVVPSGAPTWLAQHPFMFSDPLFCVPDGDEPVNGQTNNSMISSAFITAHPNVRFDPALGKLGGEDMVFFHQAREAGLQLRHSSRAVVSEEASVDRLTLGYYLRSAFWFGNTQFVTSRRTEEISRGRGLLRGGRRLAEAVIRPVPRLVSGKSPELIYTVALACSAVGLMLGSAGVRLRHPM